MQITSFPKVATGREDSRLDTINNAFDRAFDFCDRVHAVVALGIGSLPAEAPAKLASVPMPPDGNLSRVSDRADLLAARLAAALDDLNRLDVALTLNR